MKNFRFDRMEAAGSLGDLGTLLPLAIGMILINGLSAASVFFSAGLFYILAGVYFRIPVAVQPMKVIGAYAVTYGLTPAQIISSSLCMGALLIFLGTTGLIQILGRIVPGSAIRGVQLSVGVALMMKGFDLMARHDPIFGQHTIGPLSPGLLTGTAGLLITFLLLDNRRTPAALVVVGAGFLVGLISKGIPSIDLSRTALSLPELLPYGAPSWDDILWVIPVVVLPQIPMTIGNAVIANTDLAREYFGSRAGRTTFRSVSISQGLAGIASFFLGGIPMCHGAGGLAAHYRFGARTAGSNVIIGGLFAGFALLLGDNMINLLKLLPISVLGVLLVFAGSQLAIMIRNLEEKKDYFTAVIILGIALTSNLGIAFLAGTILAWLLKSGKFSV
ncbi:MAG TPA: sulfate permease [Thermodesulfobacteriaceae bacterium]|nr:sulfate permease [Thermodesulfobacteriaceae bacterium]